MSKRRKNKHLSEKLTSKPFETISHSNPVESYSGLDPIYTVKSAAALEGNFLKKALTGRLRTKNPFLLILMGLVGIVIILPSVCAVIERVRPSESQVEVIQSVDPDGAIFLQVKNPPGPEIPTAILIVFGLMAIFGLIVLANLAINLWKIKRSNPNLNRE